MKILNYDESADIFEKKFGKNLRDYKNSHDHFGKWLKLADEAEPDYPSHLGNKLFAEIDGKEIEITKEKYDEMYAKIHKQYQRYKEWSKDNPEPEYCDFWYWILNNFDDDDLFNEVPLKLKVKNYDENIEEWVKDILDKYCELFSDFVDKDGFITIDISE